ncbi:hypothetical protein BJX68DRAFT_38589 [Aspergillus pseudodeflectus]|uniref:Uncharacterized protein n=1 Tax=Aspergillus pseudodeflectus TaxID=176178 RepID=A0ABR4KP58_9EURO
MSINNDYRLRAAGLPIYRLRAAGLPIIEAHRLTFVITVYLIHIMVRTPFVVDHLTARKGLAQMSHAEINQETGVYVQRSAGHQNVTKVMTC